MAALEKGKKTRVMIVDDHEVVRVGLAALLEREEDLTVVSNVGRTDEVMADFKRLRPDVVVMDIRMPGESGIELCRTMLDHDPDTRVIMLTAYANEEAVMASIMAGAKGYVLKEIGSQELVKAIKTVAAGESLLDPAVTEQVLRQIRNSREGQILSHPDLNDNERKILELIAEGKTNREIADEVFLSEKTVRNYVSSILNKLKLKNRSQVAAYAAREKLWSSR